MASVVDICNKGLIRIGIDPIGALTDQSKAARKCKVIYDLDRQAVLRAHPWNFAMKRATLAKSSTIPEFDYSAYFDLPNECLRVWYVGETYLDFRIEGRLLAANADTITILYIKDESSPGNFDPSFVECLALKIAGSVCQALTGDKTLSKQVKEEYIDALKQARSYDGQESAVMQIEHVDLITARFGEYG